MALDYAEVTGRQLQENGGGGSSPLKRYHEWLLTGKCLVTRGVQVEVASTPEGRFIDPPPDYFHCGDSSDSITPSESRSSSTASPLTLSDASSLKEKKTLPGSHAEGHIPDVNTLKSKTHRLESEIAQSSPDLIGQKNRPLPHLKTTPEANRLATPSRGPLDDGFIRISSARSLSSMDDNVSTNLY